MGMVEEGALFGKSIPNKLSTPFILRYFKYLCIDSFHPNVFKIFLSRFNQDDLSFAIFI